MQAVALCLGYAGRGAELPAQCQEAALIAQGALDRIEDAMLFHQTGGQRAACVPGMAQQMATGRGDHYLVMQLVAVHQLHDRLQHGTSLCAGAAIDFQLIVLELRKRLKQLLQGGSRAGLFPAGRAEAGVQTVHLFGGMARDLAHDPGGALQGRVVDHHQLVVSGQVQVQLHPCDTGLQRLVKARQGVFRRLATGAPVTVYEHAAPQLLRLWWRTACTTWSYSKYTLKPG